MENFKIKGVARQDRRARARYKPQGAVSAAIARESGPHAGKAFAKAVARVRVTVKGEK
jgi:hypothetical protein